MTLAVAAPSPVDTRSAYADWMELQALSQPRSRATSATLSNVLDIASDDAAELLLYDAEVDEYLDNEIIEENRNDLISMTFEELVHRQAILGDSYPFSVGERGQTLRLLGEDPIGHTGRAVYLFCLLVSAIRDKQIQLSAEMRDAVDAAIQDIAASNQICACLAAGGYIGGDVASFGFPRADGTGFLTALQRAYARFGAGTVRQRVPEGLPPDKNLKDGGVDVIAWRDHPDRMPGKVYLLGQCASGANWTEKSVLEYVAVLHGTWFSAIPAQFWLPAMFIPFTVHRKQEETSHTPFYEAAKNKLWHDEMRYGIVFDRLRIAYYANVCLNADWATVVQVDGHDRFEHVQRWIRTMFGLAGIEVPA